MLIYIKKNKLKFLHVLIYFSFVYLIFYYFRIVNNIIFFIFEDGLIFLSWGIYIYIYIYICVCVCVCVVRQHSFV